MEEANRVNRLWLGLALAPLALAPLALGGCARGSARTRLSPGGSPAQVRFREVAVSAGLKYEWGNKGRSPLTNLETFWAGCAFLDFNRDGRMDALMVGRPGCRLFLGDGKGRFTDVT